MSAIAFDDPNPNLVSSGGNRRRSRPRSETSGSRGAGRGAIHNYFFAGLSDVFVQRFAYSRNSGLEDHDDRREEHGGNAGAERRYDGFCLVGHDRAGESRRCARRDKLVSVPRRSDRFHHHYGDTVVGLRAGPGTKTPAEAVQTLSVLEALPYRADIVSPIQRRSQAIWRCRSGRGPSAASVELKL